uniref:Uncharacterized protein n=1 Tax=Sinocyclocheilus rhinocerous TaxID=307959 RepID=A0A673MAC4_9TELE
MKTKEHDVLQRQRVVDLWKDGKSEGSIGHELRMPKSTVHSIIVKYRLSTVEWNYLFPGNCGPLEKLSSHGLSAFLNQDCEMLKWHKITPYL